MKLGFIGENSMELLESDAKFAAANGFIGLEYNYWSHWAGWNDLTVDAAKQRREILERHGVRVSALGLWGWNHLAPDASVRRAAHAALDRGIELASVLGAEVIILGAGDIPKAPIEQKVNEFVRVFPPFLEKIEAAGLTPAFYALHGNSFFSSIEDYQRVWEKAPQVKIKYDPANWRHHGDDYLDIVRRFGDRIGHVHIKEHLYINFNQLVSQPAAGMGDIAWGKVMAFLYEHNYAGYLSFEPHGPVWGRGEMRWKMLQLSRKHLSQFLL